MNIHSPHLPTRRPLFLAATLSAALARADTLTFSDGNSLPNCTVLRYDDAGRLVYRTPTGPEAARPDADVLRIELPNDPAFTAAESAFAQKQYDPAADAYRKSLRTADAPWLRQRIATRLLLAAGALKRFDAATEAYVALATANPALARSLKPALPESRSSFLDTAFAHLTTALRQKDLTDPQRLALLQLQLDIARKRNDNPLTLKVLQEALRLSPDESFLAAAREIAESRLSRIEDAFGRGDTGQALSELNAIRPIVTDPAQQVRALDLTARALDRQASSANNPDALRKAALAYLRLATHFPKSDTTPDSLLRAAQILEETGDRAGALAVYHQLTLESPSHPAAKTAGDRAKVLEPETPGTPK